jgi:hypothetical protein
MVRLGVVEGIEVEDRRDDLLAESLLGPRLGSLGRLPLLGVPDEDGGAVALPPVAELPAGVEWVDRAEEEVEDLRIADLFGS